MKFVGSKGLLEVGDDGIEGPHHALVLVVTPLSFADVAKRLPNKLSDVDAVQMPEQPLIADPKP